MRSGHRRSYLAIPAIAIALFTGLAAMLSSAQEPVNPSHQRAAQDLASDMIFATGENILLDAQSSDDVFAAGNTILVDGVRTDHLHLAASEVAITRMTANDILAAAGQIEMTTGTVADDIVAAAGEIFIGPDFAVGGSAVLVGGAISINAPISGDLRADGGDVLLNSTVGGIARFTAETIEIGPDARIMGDLEYRSENFIMRPGAIVEGETRILSVAEKSDLVEAGNALRGLFLMLGVSILISYLLLVTALVLLAPGLMQSASARIQQQPWKSLGVGLLAAVMVPVAGAVLVWSVAGAPMAVLLFVSSVAATAIALAVAAYFAGKQVRKFALRRKDEQDGIGARLAWSSFGAVLVFILCLIPIAGPAIWLFAMLFGLGAVIASAAAAFAPASPTRS